MSDFFSKNDKDDESGFLGLIPPRWRAVAVVSLLAIFFASGSMVLFREERSNLPDAGRLSALIANESRAGRSSLPPPSPSAAVPMTGSPLPLPGVLKQDAEDPTKTGKTDHPGTEDGTTTGGKVVAAGKDEKGHPAQEDAQTAHGEGAAKTDPSQSVHIQGSLSNFDTGASRFGQGGSSLSGGTFGSRISQARATRTAAHKSGQARGVMGTGGRGSSSQCQDNLQTINSKTDQLKTLHAYMDSHGCGGIACAPCKGASAACTCAQKRCEADRLDKEIPLLCQPATPKFAAEAAPPVCVPDGSCDAAAPACGKTANGKDNCGKTCTVSGAACPPPCVATTCNANPPCGQTGTGADNCGGTCTKTGPACPPPPASATSTTKPATTAVTSTPVCVHDPKSCKGPTPACGQTAAGTDNCGVCILQGPPCPVYGGSCSTYGGSTGQFNIAGYCIANAPVTGCAFVPKQGGGGPFGCILGCYSAYCKVTACASGWEPSVTPTPPSPAYNYLPPPADALLTCKEIKLNIVPK